MFFLPNRVSSLILIVHWGVGLGVFFFLLFFDYLKGMDHVGVIDGFYPFHRMRES